MVPRGWILFNGVSDFWPVVYLCAGPPSHQPPPSICYNHCAGITLDKCFIDSTTIPNALKQAQVVPHARKAFTQPAQVEHYWSVLILPFLIWEYWKGGLQTGLLDSNQLGFKDWPLNWKSNAIRDSYELQLRLRFLSRKNHLATLDTVNHRFLLSVLFNVGTLGAVSLGHHSYRMLTNVLLHGKDTGFSIYIERTFAAPRLCSPSVSLTLYLLFYSYWI